MEYKLPKTENEILALIGPVSVQEHFEYLKFHAKRYKYLLEVISKTINEEIPLWRGGSERDGVDKFADSKLDDDMLKYIPIKNKILDIGTGFEVQLFRDIFKVLVDTAGFYHSGWPEKDGETFYELDLNKLENLSDKVHQKYPLIIMAEVIEHIYTAPELVLPKIKNWLLPDGILVIQTPNAVALPKRLKMLFGIHPFEKIRLNSANPGHFREYTLEELTTIVETVGFKVLFASRKNYFSPNNKFLRFLYSLEFLWPKSLRTGITLVVKKL
jgi:hypothetical protein